MRTYTHGVIGYLLYVKRPPAERRMAVIGGILPDVIVGVGFIFHVAEPWTGLATVARLHALLHHSSLHTVTIALHSFTIIGALLALAWLFRHQTVPLLVGMLAHAIVDLLTHRTWAYNHLYPIPLPPVRGLASYTDVWFTILEHAALLAFVLWLASRRWSGRSVPVPATTADDREP